MHKHLHIYNSLQKILKKGRRKKDNEEDQGAVSIHLKNKEERIRKHFNHPLHFTDYRSLYATSLEGFVTHAFWLSIHLTKELKQTNARNEKGTTTSDRPGYRSQ